MLLSPFLVAIVTQAVKHIIPWLMRTNPNVLRLIVAVFSFGSAVGDAVLSGGEVDAVSIKTFVETVLFFLSSTGLFFLGRAK